MATIADIHALEILDSRGHPTVRSFITLDDGIRTKASVPSGASTGSHEAVERRDNDEKRYNGKGVLQEVEHVSTTIKNALVGMDISDPKAIDEKLLALDGTEDKSNLGANALLSVSLAVMRAYAQEQKKPLWQAIHDLYFPDGEPSFPRLMVNIVNGGKHANWAFDIQEFMISPNTNIPSESIRMAAEIFHSLGKYLHNKGLLTLVGDEGGFAPALPSNEAVFEAIIESARSVGYENVKDYRLGIDVAASEFYVHDAYRFRDVDEHASGKELAEYYAMIGKKYSIMSLEDGFAEDDWESFMHFQKLADEHGFMNVGDDLFTTNTKRIQKGIDEKSANTVLVKVNQIGTLKETIDAIKLTRSAGWQVIISHRSGETEDPFIADLAYGSAADFIKAGSMSRSDRMAKYNRLLEIEQGL